MAGKTHFPMAGGNQWAGALRFYDYGKPTGNVIWVNSVTGTNSTGYGFSPDSPIASIAYAFSASLVSADNDDVVYVMPKHTETLTAAGTVTANVAGVRIIGLGVGRQRPKINYTTAVGASLDVTAARISIENVYFTMTGFDAITAGINVSAADFTLANCEIEFADATNQAVLAILTTAAADRLTIRDCWFHGSADAGTATAMRIVGGDGHLILNNFIQGNFTTTLGGIQNVTTACTNTIIKGNVIQNRTASAAVCITMVSTSTGHISRNDLQVLTGTAPIVAAAMSWSGGNYYAATIATAGTLI